MKLEKKEQIEIAPAFVREYQSNPFAFFYEKKNNRFWFTLDNITTAFLNLGMRPGTHDIDAQELGIENNVASENVNGKPFGYVDQFAVHILANVLLPVLERNNFINWFYSLCDVNLYSPDLFTEIVMESFAAAAGSTVDHIFFID